MTCSNCNDTGKRWNYDAALGPVDLVPCECMKTMEFMGTLKDMVTEPRQERRQELFFKAYRLYEEAKAGDVLA